MLNQPPIWKTGDWRYLLPSQMDELHIRNCIARLERSRDARQFGRRQDCPVKGPCPHCDALDQELQNTIAWISTFKNELLGRQRAAAAKPHCQECAAMRKRIEELEQTVGRGQGVVL